jgi:hypothetical protein
MGCASNTEATEVDLSEFCLQPPPGLTESELQAFQAEQDAELARFLQQQEAKKEALKEKLNVIESQDHELATLLAARERAKAKRLKERARIKAISKANGNGQSTNDTHSRGSRTSDEYIVFQNQHQSQEQQHYNTTNSSDEKSMPLLQPQYCDTPSPPQHASAQASAQPVNGATNFHNIAMDLDPTYNKAHVVETTIDENGLHFARLCRVSPCSSESPSPISTVRSIAVAEPLDVYDNETGQCLPVQGHRRTSPDKIKRSKKKDKEGCKTQ